MVIDTQREILGPYANLGFSVEEPDDHVLVLKHNGEVVCRFWQDKADKWVIRQNCELHLTNHTLPENNSCR